MIKDPDGTSVADTLTRIIDEYNRAGSVLTNLAQDFIARERDHRQTPVSGNGNSTHPGSGLGVVRISCLGRFHLELDGQPLQRPPGGRPLAVLKFLAARAGRPTPRDVLLEALWPEADTAASTNRLRVAVHALRKSLGEHASHLVEHFEGCYAFSPNNPVVLDTDIFEKAWRQAGLMEKAQDEASAIESLEAAESLYSGDFLEEDIYEDWTHVEREFLRDIFLNVLAKLAMNSLETGDYPGCLDRCKQIIRHDYCNEEAYRLLMEAHIAMGQPARALRWYEICSDNLKRELDSSPSSRLLELKSSITS